MKKILLLTLLLNFSFSYTQISDSDARIMYQHGEDLYNENKFYDASQQMLQLKEKMGNWNPKVLYLHLKSAYKSYTENTQKSQQTYHKDYKTFAGFVSLCDEFFKIIDNNYPQTKYQEIQQALKYFKAQAQNYIGQKDRTPQDAIDFLNELALRFKTKFRNKFGVPNEVWFEIRDSYLIAKNIYHRESVIRLRDSTQKKKNKPWIDFKSTFPYRVKYSAYWVKIFDMSKVESLTPAKCDDKDCFFLNLLPNIQSFEETTFEGRIVADSIPFKNEKEYLNYEYNNKEAHNYNTLDWQEKNSSWTLQISNKIKNNSYLISEKNKGFNYNSKDTFKSRSIDLSFFFNIEDDEFVRGNYTRRILDALNFIIQETPKVENAEENKGAKNKF